LRSNYGRYRSGLRGDSDENDDFVNDALLLMLFSELLLDDSDSSNMDSAFMNSPVSDDYEDQAD
jgi:hypothetical protein